MKIYYLVHMYLKSSRRLKLSWRYETGRRLFSDKLFMACTAVHKGAVLLAEKIFNNVICIIILIKIRYFCIINRIAKGRKLGRTTLD